MSFSFQIAPHAIAEIKKILIYILVWLIISVLAGMLGTYLFNINFWTSSLVAGLALILNGMIAEWEDRRDGPGSNSGSKRERDG